LLGKAYTRLIGLRVYTLSAKYLGEVKDVGLSLEEGTPLVYMVVAGASGSIGVPVSAIKAVGDIIILEEGYEEKIVEIPGAQRGDQDEKNAPPPAPNNLLKTSIHEPRQEPLRTIETSTAPLPRKNEPREPVIPRCPRCGTALVYEPRKKRWYCPSCKKYAEIPASIEARVPRCPYCGLPLSYIEQYRKWYCYNCKRYISLGGG